MDFNTTYHLLKICYAFVQCLKKHFANCVTRNEVYNIQNYFSKGSQAFLCPKSLSPFIKLSKSFILNRLNYCGF